MIYEEIIIFNEQLAFAEFSGRLGQIGSIFGQTNHSNYYHIDMVKPGLKNDYIISHLYSKVAPYDIKEVIFDDYLVSEINKSLSTIDKSLGRELESNLRWYISNFEYKFKAYSINSKFESGTETLIYIKANKEYFLHLGWSD